MNFLIVDDHPAIVEFYKLILREYFQDDLNIDVAYNCKEAYNLIINQVNYYHLSIIDHNLPGYLEKNIHSGIELIDLIRKVNRNSKTVLITGYNQKILLYNILKHSMPDALSAKESITSENFIQIIISVLEGNQFLCSVVKQAISEVCENDILIDEYNREILINLSKGYKTNELKFYIPLAEITIKKIHK